MDRRERIRTKTASIWREAKYAGVGIEFGISIAACYWIGDWAQDRWGFAPWGALGGVLIGFASGLRRLIKIAEVESRRPSPHSTAESPPTGVMPTQPSQVNPLEQTTESLGDYHERDSDPSA